MHKKFDKNILGRKMLFKKILEKFRKNLLFQRT